MKLCVKKIIKSNFLATCGEYKFINRDSLDILNLSPRFYLRAAKATLEVSDSFAWHLLVVREELLILYYVSIKG